MIKLKRWYTAVALLFFNTLILLIVLNAGLSIGRTLLEFRPPVETASVRSRTPLGRFGERILQAYPGRSTDEIGALLDEGRVTGFERFRYDPITQFKVKPFHGRFIHLTEHGFRAGKNQGPWPPDPQAFNVFTFGGSTMFGSYLADDETIASWLQEHMTNKMCGRSVHVYNFGQPAFISTQEMLFFYELLSHGHRPDIVIFYDGLNDLMLWNGEPLFTDKLHRLMEGNDRSQIFGVLDRLAISRAISELQNRLRSDGTVFTSSSYKNDQVFNDLLHRLRTNRQVIEAIARQYGVRPVFVWQPIPTFKYDLPSHFAYDFYRGRPFPSYQVGHNYERLERFRPEFEKTRNFLWLADIQQGRKENLYVDEIHYTSAFSREIALNIFDFIQRSPDDSWKCTTRAATIGSQGGVGR
jgi:hypothetical protein